MHARLLNEDGRRAACCPHDERAVAFPAVALQHPVTAVLAKTAAASADKLLCFNLTDHHCVSQNPVRLLQRSSVPSLSIRAKGRNVLCSAGLRWYFIGSLM